MNDGLKFFCSVETPSHAGMPPWWFFEIDNRQRTRYAPFAAAPTDTKESVQSRIIAFYTEMLATEARPAYQRPSWKKPAPPPAADAPADAPADAAGAAGAASGGEPAKV